MVSIVFPVLVIDRKEQFCCTHSAISVLFVSVVAYPPELVNFVLYSKWLESGVILPWNGTVNKLECLTSDQKFELYVDYFGLTEKIMSFIVLTLDLHY